MVIWAGNFIVVKDALNELPPVGFTTIRFLLATAALFIACRIREGSVSLPRRDLLPIAALGAFGFGIYQPLWTVALGQTTAGDSALLVASTPIFTLLIAAAIGSDVLTRARLLGALVAFAGVSLVVLSGSGDASGGRLVGNLLTVVAAACWAIYVAFGASVLRRHSPLRTTAWTVLFGSLLMLPIGAWQLAEAAPRTLTIATPLAVLYAGLISIGLGNVIYSRGVQIVGPTRTANLQFLVPAMAVVLATVFLGEQVRLEQVVGGAVIVLGILVARGGGPARLVLRGA
jgi:drug/metabolite transporter (DMT)-like permease